MNMNSETEDFLNESDNPSNPGISRILFVDDERMIRDLGEKMLEILGHKADVVASGKEALTLLENNQYDLIISDIGMPQMSGWEFAEKIKGRFEGTKIALLSGWNENLTAEYKEKFGLDYILEKPISMNDLKKVVDDAVQAKHSTL